MMHMQPYNLNFNNFFLIFFIYIFLYISKLLNDFFFFIKKYINDWLFNSWLNKKFTNLKYEWPIWQKCPLNRYWHLQIWLYQLYIQIVAMYMLNIFDHVNYIDLKHFLFSGICLLFEDMVVELGCTPNL